MAAWFTQESEVLVEEMAKVVDAIKVPGASEAGREAYTRGILNKLDQLKKTHTRMAEKKKMPSFDSCLLAMDVATPLNITVVPRAAKTVTRKTVESYTPDGRIKSLIEEQVEV